MKADDMTSTWAKEGHTVLIGPVKTEWRDGKNRHHREIILDGEVIGKSEGRDLVTARYRSAFAVDSKLRARK